MTEEEKIKMLLQPRYKVTADYPGNPFGIDTIIPKRVDAILDTDEFDKYPALFRKLEWWQDRTQEEMPDYLKHQESQTVNKIIKWEGTFGFTNISVRQGCELSIWKPEYGYLPATSSEYHTFIHQVKK